MLLQANIGGYGGRNATVIGFIDHDNDTLYIERTDNMVEQRFNDAGLITNQPLDDLDYFFSEQDFRQAFQDFRFYQNSQRLIFSPEAMRATPMLQVDKITESGTQLAIYGEISNEQLAVIALCFFAKKVSEYQDTIALYEDEESEDFITIM